MVQLQEMLSFDQFIQQLNEIAPEIKSILKEIRNLDFEFENLQLHIQGERQKFLLEVDKLEGKKDSFKKKELQLKYKYILELDRKLMQLAKSKVQLAQKLYDLVHDPAEKLDKQLKLKGQNSGIADFEFKGKKGKKKGRPNKEEWENDPIQPKYCYCRKPSYGEMVKCEDRECQMEWFHRLCIDEKKLPEFWYCKNCRSKK